MASQLSTREEIGGAYSGAETAAAYVEQRFTNELMRLLHERQVTAVQRVFDQHRPMAALELAPGPGRVTRDVRPTGRLACLEFNEGMMATGMAACRNGAEWVQGDAFRLPFQEKFQFVYTFRFIRHFHRAQRELLYEQIRSVLERGGRLVFDAVNERVSAPLRNASPDEYPIYDKLYGSERDLTDELRKNGFEVVRLEPVQRWFSLQSRSQVLLGPRSRRLCRWTIHLLENLRRGPALEWIVECRRA